MNAIRVLATACHPAPAAAVTIFGTALAIRAGDSAATCVLVFFAVGTGQLSIGWSNDRIDVARDRSVGRTDKPLVASPRWHRTVDIAIVTAVLATVAFSLSLGWRAGLVHLAAVSCAWLYNLGLKSTVVSWLPYAVAFGLLPAVATLALPGHPWPAWWIAVGGALLGVTAHLANVVPDVEEDRATGIVGFAHRLGPRGALAGAALLAAGASVLIVAGPNGPPTAAGWAGLVVGTIAAAGALVGAARGLRSKVPFYGVIVIAAVDLVVLFSYGRLAHAGG